MIMVNIAEAKAKLSHYIKLVEDGETVMLCRHNVAIIELKPVKAVAGNKRSLGKLANKIRLHGQDFLDPLEVEDTSVFTKDSLYT